jgi:hypothetical protein
MTCPSCGQPTVTTPDGRHLQPARSRIGRYLPDGTEISIDELRQGVRAHPVHHCPPTAAHPAPSTQDALF